MDTDALETCKHVIDLCAHGFLLLLVQTWSILQQSVPLLRIVHKSLYTGRQLKRKCWYTIRLG